jgi:hypothetical protein
MSLEKPLPILVALIALVLGASVAGVLLMMKKKQGVGIAVPAPADVS